MKRGSRTKAQSYFLESYPAEIVEFLRAECLLLARKAAASVPVSLDLEDMASAGFYAGLVVYPEYEATTDKAGKGVRWFVRCKARFAIYDYIRHQAGRHARKLHFTSLEEMLSAGDERELKEILPVHDEPPDGSLCRKEASVACQTMLGELSDRRLRFIVEQYYFEERTLREIGAMLRVTETRICQLHKKALGQLKGGLPQH